MTLFMLSDIFLTSKVRNISLLFWRIDMKNKVTLRELVASRIVLAICVTVYYWCWARNDWHDYYVTIQNVFAVFTVLFFLLLFARERKYRKEVSDELATANLRRCNSICFKISMIAIVVIAFLSAALRFTISSEIIGYCLMGLVVCISIIRTILFCLMDIKGI